MTTTTTSPVPVAAPDYRGRCVNLYHPNGRGTGSALRLEPRLNRDGNDRYNCFFLEMAAQKSMASRKDQGVTPATFDWSNKITVKLNFLDLAEILTVLEGRADKVGGERNGLYHATRSGNTLISLVRNTDQRIYHLSLSHKKSGDAQPRKVGITLSETEATGLRCLIQTGLFYVTFSALMSNGTNANR